MVLEKVKARFQEPLEVDPRRAHEMFEEEKRGEIEEAEASIQGFREEVEDALEELDRRLEELEEYEDPEGRSVVEDVVENIAADRRRMVDQLAVPSEPGKLRENLESFSDSFREMKRKENEVLGTLGEEKKPVFEALDSVEELEERVSSFLENDYRVVERREKLEDLVQELERLEERREEIEGELEEIELTSIREELDKVESDLEELTEGSEWEEYRNLEEQLEEAREERKDIRGEIERTANRMERGLKKLLYEVENGDLSLESRDILEEIRDREIDSLLEREADEVEETVQVALDTLPGDLLGERQRKKFTDAAEEMERLGEKQEEIQELTGRIEDLEEQLESHPAPQEKERLAAEKEGVKEELQEKRDKRSDLREEREEVEEEIDRVRNRIREELQEAFHRDIRFSTGD